MVLQIKEKIDQIRRDEVPEKYKKTKVGIVPADWSSFSLGDLYTERKESGIPALPILTVSIHSGVSDGALDDDELGKKIKRIEDKTQYKTARSGDIVFNMMRAWQGAIGVARQDGLVSPAYIVATPSKVIYPPFMDYNMKTSQMINLLHRKSYGVTDFRLRLYWDSFAMVNCVLPPLPEQEKIAEILTTQDKVIALKEKLLEEKKKQKKYLMQQLLTGKKRLPGFSGEWNKVKLSNVLEEGSKVGVSDTSKYKKMTVKLAFKGLEFTKADREMVDTRPFYVRRGGEIIIGKQNYFNGSVALVTDEFDGCICSNAIMSFTVINANAKFVFEYISQTNFMKKHEMLANGTGQKELSEKVFLEFEIHLPSVEEQNIIANIATTCDNEISLIQKNLDQEKQKKKALMQLLLTGIVRVKI